MSVNDFVFRVCPKSSLEYFRVVRVPATGSIHTNCLLQWLAIQVTKLSVYRGFNGFIEIIPGVAAKCFFASSGDSKLLYIAPVYPSTCFLH